MLQLITTKEELQLVVNAAVANAFAMFNIVPEASVPPDIINTRELCNRLGLSEPTVIRWRKKGKIPSFNIGSAVRFDYEAVLQALKTNTKRRGKG